MKTMVERNEVLHRYRVQGQSKRSIAREMGMSRHTVDKIIEEYERLCLDSEGVCDMEAFEALTGTKPRFHTPERPFRAVTPDMVAIMRRCLEENRQRKAMGQRKLQWHNKDIHNYLLEKGFEISYSSVCNHVRRICATMGPRSEVRPEVYIKREHPAGRECEFDWGEVPILIEGEREKIQMAVFTLLHSNRRSAWLFRRQDTLALMEAHRNFFMEVNGVPETMVYDNMKVAVTVKTGGRGKPAKKYPTHTMQRLSLHYGFRERFCNARAGWEKGSVERSVEVVRRAAFVSRTSFLSLDEAQAWLDAALARLNSVSGIPGVTDSDKQWRIQADLEALRPCPSPMGCFEAEERRPDKYCTVTVDSNNYSVPDTHMGRLITVKIYSNHLVMLHGGVKIASHARLRGKGGWSMQLDHYLGTFLRKPGALDSSTALRQVPSELAELYRVHFSPDRQKEFIAFMLYARDSGILHNEITASARRLRAKGVRHITADHLKVDIEASRNGDDPSDKPVTDLMEGSFALQEADIEKQAFDTLEHISATMGASKGNAHLLLNNPDSDSHGR